MGSGIKNGRKYRIECFNHCGVGREPGDFLRSGGRQAHLQTSGPEWIHATDERLTIQRSSGGECILDCVPRNGEKQNIGKTNCIGWRARSSARANLADEMLQLLRCSRVAEHYVMSVIRPETSQTRSHFSRTNDPYIHGTIVSEMPGSSCAVVHRLFCWPSDSINPANCA